MDVTLDKVSFMCAMRESATSWLDSMGVFDDSCSCSWRHKNGCSQVVVRQGNAYISADVVQSRSVLETSFRWASPEPVRIEFNPNRIKASDLRLAMLGVLSARPTRLDVALDYCDVSLADWTFRRSGTKGSYFHRRNGEPEGYYLGSLASLKVFRIYDKVEELISSTKRDQRDRVASVLLQNFRSGLSRVECVQRLRPAFEERPASEVLPADLMDTLDVTRSVVPSGGLRPYQAGLLALYHHEPSVLASMDRDVRKAARELAVEVCGVISPSPADAFRDARARLLDDVSRLAAGEGVERASVYQLVEPVSRLDVPCAVADAVAVS